MYGTAGKVVIAAQPIAVTQNVLGIVPKPIVDTEFLYYALAHARETLLRLADSTIFKYISLAKVKALPIPMPPLQEQRDIAHVLRAVQDAIQARRRELALERERKAALMQRLFTKGTRGEPTKQTEIGEMPESWRVVHLGGVCQLIQYGTSEQCNEDSTGGARASHPECDSR
jgi:type I restriction enzyme S subunit